MKSRGDSGSNAKVNTVDKNSAEAMDYGQFYYLEQYLFETVTERFREQGFLQAFDFFCIVIWKANRAKSKTALRMTRLDNLPGKNLDERIRRLTETLFNAREHKERLRYLMKDLKFRLPMASAILTVLYPNDFTVYDMRVCRELPDSEKHLRLLNRVDPDAIWDGYIRFKNAVEEEAQGILSLRDKDRFLWGKSFHDQLRRDLEHGFNTKK